jgi:hypothetical protein
VATGFRKRAGEFVARHTVWMVGAGAVVVLAVLIGVPLASADSAGFFSRYKNLSQSYERLESSSHKGLPCGACHFDRRNVLVRDLALAGDFYANILGKQASPIFTAFQAPTNDACLGCHRGDWSMESSRTAQVPHPAHLRVAAETRDCVKCHKWTAHEESYMQKHKAMPFSGVCVAYGCHVGTKKTDECSGCHHSLAKGDWKAEHPKLVRVAGPNGCLESCHEIAQCRECHTTGKQPHVQGVAVQAGLQAIQILHVKPDWIERHGSIARDEQPQCMKCHVSDGECRACHARRPAFHGPQNSWIGTHKNVAKDNERRCVTACHEKPWCDECHKQFKEMR